MRGEGLGQIIRVTLRTQGRGCLAHGHGRARSVALWACTISRTLGPTLAFKNMSHPTDPQQRKAMASALRLQKREGGKEGGRYVMEQSKRSTWNSTPLSWMRSWIF